MPPASSTKIALAAPGPGKTIRKFKAGDTIYRQGERATSVFYVQSGKVKVTVYSPMGNKDAIVAVAEAGDFVGEGCLDGSPEQHQHPKRGSTTQALESSVLIEIEIATMRKMLDEDQGFNRLFLDYMMARNERVEADLVYQLNNDTQKRLARLLIEMSHIQIEGAPKTIPVAISQEALGTMVGSSRQHVNRFLRKFTKLGFISYSGRQITVHPALLLAAFLNVKPNGISTKSHVKKGRK